MNQAEYRAKREWLRLNLHGPRAQLVRRELRAWDRELERRGVVVEEWVESARTRLTLSPWYVAFFHDRPGQPLASQARHKDRYCQYLYNLPDEDARRPRPRWIGCRRAPRVAEPVIGASGAAQRRCERLRRRPGPS